MTMKKVLIFLGLIILIGINSFSQYSRTIITKSTVAINGTTATLTGVSSASGAFNVDMNAVWCVTIKFTSMSNLNGYVHMEAADTLASAKNPNWTLMAIDSIMVTTATFTATFEGDFLTRPLLRWYYRNGSSTTGSAASDIIWTRKM